MNTNIKFTSKETYLAYRSEWKVKYKAISNEIRIYKPVRREPRHVQYKGR